MFRKRSLILSCLLSSLAWPTFAQHYAALDVLPSGTRSSLLIADLASGKSESLTDNADQLFPPASTLKLVTTLAAKLSLGDQFRYQTKLAQAGNDLVLTFSGDPTLTTQHLINLFTSAKQKQHISHIKGNIWLDNSAFSGYEHAIGLPWDITGVCYSASSSAVTLDHNCFPASIYTLENGNTRVYVPEQYPVSVTTRVKTVSPETKKATQCELELLTFPNNHYQLQGCLTPRKQPLPLNFAFQNTELYAQKRLGMELKRLGIRFDGQIKIGRPTATPSKTLAVHQSEPLPQLLDSMLKRSDNLFADSLAKTIGAHVFKQAGNFKNGSTAIKQIIKTRTGIDLARDQIADGSGLSRNNRFSAQDMAAILSYIYRHDNSLHILSLLPVSGESGTLQYRSSMRKAPIKGQITAKSGSLYGSYNMAGYGLNKDGKPSTLFVQFVSDYYPAKSATNVAPITQMETQFYQEVIRRSQAQ